MQHCSRCILSDQYPDIRYDDQGVCHKCREHDAKYGSRDFAALGAELARTVDWARRKGKRYDCMVPFSGGKDSSYTLYYCRRKLGMNVLAVNFNNGLRTPEALANIEHITHATDTALASYGPPWETMRKLYRAFLLATGQFCFPCDMGIWAMVHRLAEDYDVPLIVSGFSAQIESRGPKIYTYSNDLFRRVASSVLTEQELKDFLQLSTKDKLLRRVKHHRLSRYRLQISLPDYIPWVDSEIKRVIRDELAWIPRGDGSSDHIDCYFAPMKGYLNIQKWGFGEKTTKYASMVRAGQMTREDAFAKASEDEGRPIGAALDLFCEKLGLTPEEVAGANDRSHLDYL